MIKLNDLWGQVTDILAKQEALAVMQGMTHQEHHATSILAPVNPTVPAILLYVKRVDTKQSMEHHFHAAQVCLPALIF